MAIEIGDDLFNNIIQDWKKRNINPIERANFLRSAMVEKDITSIRDFAKHIGLPKSTLQDWIMWEKLSEDEYENYKENGFNDTTIYRALRSENNVKQKIDKHKFNKTDLRLEQARSLVSGLIHDWEKSPNTLGLLNKLQDVVNRLKMRVERNIK